jgi:hypothetical protein
VLQSSHAMAIDGEYAIDGAQRARNTASFSPCHINHSRTRFNVARRTLRDQRRIEIFAIEDIRCGTFWQIEQRTWPLLARGKCLISKLSILL